MDEEKVRDKLIAGLEWLVHESVSEIRIDVQKLGPARMVLKFNDGSEFLVEVAKLHK